MGSDDMRKMGMKEKETRKEGKEKWWGTTRRERVNKGERSVATGR